MGEGEGEGRVGGSEVFHSLEEPVKMDDGTKTKRVSAKISNGGNACLLFFFIFILLTV